MKELEYLIEDDDRLVTMSEWRPVNVKLVSSLESDKLDLDTPLSMGEIAEQYRPDTADAYVIHAKSSVAHGCPGPAHGSARIDFYKILGE